MWLVENFWWIEQVDISSPVLFYLQACVRSLPKSELAKNCFNEYETVVIRDKKSGKESVAKASSDKASLGKTSLGKTEEPLVESRVATLDLDELRGLAYGPSGASTKLENRGGSVNPASPKERVSSTQTP